MVNKFRLRNSTSGPIRVLHVDDDPADLEITRILLKRKCKDFEIVSVLSVREALEKLESEHFDAIISEYLMPEMDGIEFLEVVRKSGKYADIPFILFTGMGGKEIAKEGLSKGADRYIDKMGDPSRQCNELAHAIEELIKTEGPRGFIPLNLIESPREEDMIVIEDRFYTDPETFEKIKRNLGEEIEQDSYFYYITKNLYVASERYKNLEAALLEVMRHNERLSLFISEKHLNPLYLYTS
ncbi:MAG: response regulator [Candidatus Methanospirareceae archaeon]